MRFTFNQLVILALLISAVAAFPPDGPPKFSRWFPLLSDRTYGTNVSSLTCKKSLAVYRDALYSPDRDYRAATCAWHQQCILDNLREDIKARMSSASVLLGLTPGLLASLGPSVAEISVLSVERPILTLLLSFGSPAVYPTRVLHYEDAIEILKETTKSPSFKWVRRSAWHQALVSAAEYLLASLAVANVIYTSFELGVRTIISFRCVSSVFPLVWTLLPIFVHLPAALAFRWSDRSSRSTEKVITRAPHHRLTKKIMAFLNKERTLCLAREKRDVSDFQPSVVTVALNYLATGLGFLHGTFGIFIFSSLLFIETLDTVTVILRYMASSVICRIILMFEIHGIKSAQAGQWRTSTATERTDITNTRYSRV